MPTVWSRYTPPDRTTFRRRCSWRSSRICDLCTRNGDARSTTTPPTRRSRTRLAPRALDSPTSGSRSGRGSSSGSFDAATRGDASRLRPNASAESAPRVRDARHLVLARGHELGHHAFQRAQRDAVERALDVGGDDERGRRRGRGDGRASSAAASRIGFFLPDARPSSVVAPRASFASLRRAPSSDERPESSVRVAVVADVGAHHARLRARLVPEDVEHPLKAGVHRTKREHVALSPTANPRLPSSVSAPRRVSAARAAEGSKDATAGRPSMATGRRPVAFGRSRSLANPRRWRWSKSLARRRGMRRYAAVAAVAAAGSSSPGRSPPTARLARALPRGLPSSPRGARR